MSSTLKVQIQQHGHETTGVPVHIEVLDPQLRPVEEKWVTPVEVAEFKVEPGLYGIRASVASGAKVEQTVEVGADETVDCSLPLYSVSPHESHEWAYLTQSSDQPREYLSEKRYGRLWIRLWRRDFDGQWETNRLVIKAESTWDQDGVNYHISKQNDGLLALQIGGPEVPWKCIALPPSYDKMILIRPTSAPTGRTHPIDVIVSSDDFEVETLLQLMQRGDTSSASEWAKKTSTGNTGFLEADHQPLAERLLFGKRRNTAAAAVGGYYLLRTGDLDRLHNWANNLANWFEWMADGPVIHAWQVIRESYQNATSKLETARERLLEAEKRGFPIYTEGLRLLRDGLLMFHRQAKGQDEEIASALRRIVEYTSVADWSAPTTTFTGNQPAEPLSKPRKGEPRKRGTHIYVYDVPVQAVIRSGAVEPGEVLTRKTPSGKTWSCRIGEDGKLQFDGQREFKSMTALNQEITGSTSVDWWSWQREDGTSLGDAVQQLRTKPLIQ